MSLPLVLFIPFLLILTFLILKWKDIRNLTVMIYKCYHNFEKLPGPHAYPVVGATYQFKLNSAEFTTQILGWMKELLFDDPNKPGLLKAWVGPIPILLVISPEHCKTILESNSLITKSSFYSIVQEWIGTGVLISTNEKWFSRRKMLTPAFHFNVLKDYAKVFVRQGEILADQLEKHADTEREMDIFPFIKRCALDIICETAMGTEMHTQVGGNTEYVDAVTKISDIMWSYLRFPWLWLKPIWYGCGLGFEFNRLVKMTNDFTRKVIAERRQTLEEDGTLDVPLEGLSEAELKKRKLVFLDLLLTKQKANALSDEDIREEVDTFMFEGHDTTASAMAFAVWFLGQYPEYQKKVHDELDEIFGDSDRDPDENDVKKLVYLERCIKEALRLCPSVAMFARHVSHDVQLGDITVPENTTIILAPFGTHRDPEQFEYPETFYPDHFTHEAIAKRHPYAYFPFSAGPRNCIGQKFALAEEKTVLSWLFRRYRVETVEPFPGNRPLPEIILKPGDGVICRIYRRRRTN